MRSPESMPILTVQHRDGLRSREGLRRLAEGCSVGTTMDPTSRFQAASFLRLLVEEADPTAFAAMSNAWRAVASSAEEAAGIDTNLGHALHLRAILDERKRRERELGALFETARDLAQLRDVQVLLQAIVRRARHLLQTDSAYLMLIDSRQHDIYMRVSDGTVSADFQQIRLPLGAGLGGLVAAHHAPYWTPNYLADVSYRHTNAVDDVVAKERLISILGVPLEVGGEITGVLFASDRAQRDFLPSDVSLLCSFAALAAVALENARVLARAHQAVTELNAVNAIVREHSEAVERAADAHARMTALVAGGSDLKSLVASVVETLGGRSFLVDISGSVHAQYGDAVDELDAVVRDNASLRNTRFLPAILDAVVSTSRSGRCAQVSLSNGLTRWLAPVLGAGEELGALLIAPSGDMTDVDQRTLDRAAQVTALLLLNRRAIAHSRQRGEAECIELLVSGDDVDRATAMARSFGVDLDSPHCVVVVSVPSARMHVAAATAADFVVSVGGLAGRLGRHLVVIVPGVQSQAIVRLVWDRVGAAVGAPVTAGAAGPGTGRASIVDAYIAARRCVHALSISSREGDFATSEDLGMYALLMAEANRGSLDRFIDDTLGPILVYDAARGTQLIKTLTEYFASREQPAPAAGRLHIHVNTLYQRLARVRDLLASDIDEPEMRLQLHLATRLHRLRVRDAAGSDGVMHTVTPGAMDDHT